MASVLLVGFERMQSIDGSKRRIAMGRANNDAAGQEEIIHNDEHAAFSTLPRGSFKTQITQNHYTDFSGISPGIPNLLPVLKLPLAPSMN